MPAGGDTPSLPGVTACHPGGVTDRLKGGDSLSPIPLKSTQKEKEEERSVDLPGWLDPELWKRFMGKAHNCPRINDRSLAYGFLWGWA